jgi:fumarate reductase flavoprotein subunit
MLDVAIVGGGLAGLVAANRAAEFGLRVAVLEQGADTHYACNSRIATGSLNLAHSNPLLPSKELLSAIDADTEGHADPILAAAIVAVAGRGLNWLKEQGAELIRREVQDKQTWMLAPPRSFSPGLDWQGRGADVLLDRLAANLKRRGGEILLSARALALVVEAGSVCGVVAEIGGAIREIRASAVILADGGFQCNADLLRRYVTPCPAALVQRSAGTGRGDGIRMAAAIGAKLVDMDRFYGHLLSRAAMTNPDLWPYPTLDSLTGGSMVIDRSGRRIFDEGLGGITLSNRIAALEDPLSMAIVFDEEIWTTAGRDELVPANPHLREAGGTMHVAPTLDALAKLIDVPAAALAATVRQYNEAIRAGRLDGLEPPRSPGRRFGVLRSSPERILPRPVEHAPFYAAPLAVGISCTMGGIAIDTAGRALRENGGPIAGLYAAGSTIGGLEGGPIAGYIGGLAKAYCTALIAAESIAATRGIHQGGVRNRATM